jgi:type II secretory pathway component PulL
MLLRMMLRRTLSMICCISAFAVYTTIFAATAPAQTQTTTAAPTETAPELVARLTPPQKQLFNDATKAFNTQHYSDALAACKQLLKTPQRRSTRSTIPMLSPPASNCSISCPAIRYS